MSTDSQCSAPGAGRPAYAVAGTPAFILRAQIRNDMALIEHYNGLLQGEVELSIAQRVELLARRASVITRLYARMDQLSAALPPACTSRAPSFGDNSGTPEPITTAAR